MSGNAFHICEPCGPRCALGDDLALPIDLLGEKVRHLLAITGAHVVTNIVNSGSTPEPIADAIVTGLTRAPVEGVWSFAMPTLVGIAAAVQCPEWAVTISQLARDGFGLSTNKDGLDRWVRDLLEVTRIEYSRDMDEVTS